jgi:NAD(P)-dependent dehydrogenase (short-subunit alcohol dehydrogenase family)
MAEIASGQQGPREVRQVSYDFSGCVALITGAARGQGRRHALEFARAGADVALVDTGGDVAVESIFYGLSGKEDLDAAVADCESAGADAIGIAADVRSGEAIEAAVKKTIDRFGKIDILVCNAGVVSFAFELADMTERAWDEVVDTNMKGVFLCAKAVIPHMLEAEHGKVVITGSVNSFVGLPRTTNYTASKHGVVGFAKALALEVAGRGINVNVVCPGSINSGMVGVLEDPGVDDEVLQGISDLTGTWNIFEDGALMEPNEISQAVLWLASDASAFVTGSTIAVDAGVLAK